MLRKRPYSVPEGYFDDLQSRLSNIPHMPERKVSRWQKAQPYLALAACFCSALIIGKIILGRTAAPDASDTIYEQLIYADMIPHSEPDAIFIADESMDADIFESQEDVISYLIDTGTSIELINYFSE